MIQTMLPFYPPTPVISADDLLRIQGADPQKLRERRADIMALAEKAVQAGNKLAAPAVWQRNLSVAYARHNSIHLEDGHCLQTGYLVEQLAGASQLVFIIGSLGFALDNEIQSAMRSDPVWGFMLDSYGSACADALSRSVIDHIHAEAEEDGLGTSTVLLPGHAGWPLQQGQEQIFSILQPDPTFIRLTDCAQMLPKKSFSFLIGLGCATSNMLPCDTCDLRLTCPMRREAA